MSRIMLGIICGLVFGAIDIGIMLPMSLPDKKAAITAAFIARFGLGFVIGAARLPWPGWAVGLCFGLLLSIPDALITKAYGPIIGMGALGGTIIGMLIGRFGRDSGTNRGRLRSSLYYIGTKKAQFSLSVRMHFIEAAVFSHRLRDFEQAQIRNTPQRTGLNQQPSWTLGEDE
jgi:hypothetical protein